MPTQCWTPGIGGGVELMPGQNEGFSVQAAVSRRYAAAARAVEPELCCAVQYDARFLEAIPSEVIERDYGCGDPSRYVVEGDVVLDLGSGGGKSCFIAAQVVGPTGEVIGVDASDEMLALARGAKSRVADAIGYDNVSFLKGRIQDLSLDLERLEAHLAEESIGDLESWHRTEASIRGWRRDRPLVASDSIDIVVSNCVLNLVEPGDRLRLFEELARVLKPGGRAVISDIVASRDVPEHLQRDESLWSGCVSGAYREDRLLESFRAAGLVGVELLERQQEPWTVVEGIEFRSVTVRAFSPKPGDGPADGTADGPGPVGLVDVIGLGELSSGVGPCCGPDGECG